MKRGGLDHIAQQPVECLRETKKKVTIMTQIILDWKLYKSNQDTVA